MSFATTMMSKLAEMSTFEQIVDMLQDAINEYRIDPSDKNQEFIMFVTQILAIHKVMKLKNMDSDAFEQDIEKHKNIMDLFKTESN